MKRLKKIYLVLLLLILVFTNYSTNVFAITQKKYKEEDKLKAKQIYFDSIRTGDNGPYEYFFEPNTYILTTNNELWGSGINTHGQLGIKGISKTEKPIKIITDVKSFHTVRDEKEIYYVIKTNGELWGWGRNSKGVLGNGDNKIVWKPTKILDNVVELYKRDDQMFYALTKDKQLYTWGSSYINDKQVVKNKPIKILEKVTELGKTYYGPNYAIVNDGELWTWGNHTGAGTDKYVEKPTKILDNVGKVDFSGYYESNFYAIKKNGELWAWGGGKYDFLGDGNKVYINKPKKIMDNVKDVYPLGGESFLLTKNDELWGWGSNHDGVLGDGSKGSVSKPTKIIDNVSQFLVNSLDFFVLKKNGELWAWGDNYTDYTKLNVNYRAISIPRKIMDDIKSIESNRNFRHGGTSPFVYKNNDELWGWGKYFPNKLEFDHNKAMMPKKIKDNVDYGGYDFNFSSYLITKNKELWTWGMWTDERLEKTVDNVKETIEYSGLHAITEEGDFWIHCGIPYLTEKVAENVVSVDIALESKQGESKKIYYGLVKDNGEVWIATQNVSSSVSPSGKVGKPVRIFPVGE